MTIPSHVILINESLELLKVRLPWSTGYNEQCLRDFFHYAGQRLDQDIQPLGVLYLPEEQQHLGGLCDSKLISCGGLRPNGIGTGKKVTMRNDRNLRRRNAHFLKFYERGIVMNDDSIGEAIEPAGKHPFACR